MATCIENIKQLGIGWEVRFHPPDQADAVRGLLEGHGLRVVLVRQGSGPEGEGVGSIECELPGGELSKRRLVELLAGDSSLELAEHLKDVASIESDDAVSEQ